MSRVRDAVKAAVQLLRDGRPKHNAEGLECPDPRKVEVPLKFQRPETLEEKMQRLIRVQVSEMARAQGRESFEEADDFDVEEDGFPMSEHELSADQEAFHLAALDPKEAEKVVEKAPPKAPEAPVAAEATPPQGP